MYYGLKAKDVRKIKALPGMIMKKLLRQFQLCKKALVKRESKQIILVVLILFALSVTKVTVTETVYVKLPGDNQEYPNEVIKTYPILPKHLRTNNRPEPIDWVIMTETIIEKDNEHIHAPFPSTIIIKKNKKVKRFLIIQIIKFAVGVPIIPGQ